MPARSPPITTPPTPELQSSAEQVEEDIRRDVESAAQDLTAPLKYFQYEQIIRDFEGSFRKENETLMREFPIPSQSTDGLILLQAGKMRIEASHPVAIAITVLRTGILESEVESPEGSKSVDWGSVGSVVILPGKTMISSFGSGRLVCLFRIER